MYLKAVYELEEEGVVPLRARIAERLKQSGPTVSQTVARMERDGLLRVEGDRHLEFTAAGRKHAIAVMRKHRLCERLLTDVIGLEWDEVHVEACRWEHVMSENVEYKLVKLLDNPVSDPYGNPIPGLAELDAQAAPEPTYTLTSLSAATEAANGGEATAVVRRISEQVQNDPRLMRILRDGGVLPGATVRATGRDGAGVRLSSDTGKADLDGIVAAHIFVSAE